MNHTHTKPETPPRFWGSRYSYGLIVIGAVATYFLLTEHLAHVVDALPALLLLACLGMHLFMHHGHGAHGHARGDKQPEVDAGTADPTTRGEQR